MSATILVTDGEQRAALAAVRSLGRAGYQVNVCSTRGRSIAGASRYCRAEWGVADPLAQPGQFGADVLKLVERLDADVLLPVGDAALLASLPLRSRLGGARLPFPDVERFRAMADKAALLDAASEIGIGVPKQHVIRSPQEASERHIPAGFEFPVVLKPARSVVESGGRRLKAVVRHAASRDRLAGALAGFHPAAYPVLMQQRIVGPGVGIFLLVWNGRTQAVFAHRRIREKPPSGGVSVYRESIAAVPELVEHSRRLLDRFGWEGVAMVEYKVNSATGQAFLMEVNGRLWGSLQLAVDAGVDFPRLLVELALGGRPEPVVSYRTGVRSRWWWGDVDHLLSRLRGASDLALPPDAPPLARVLLDFLKVWRPGDRNEILRLDDPRPFLRETGLWLSGH